MTKRIVLYTLLLCAAVYAVTQFMSLLNDRPVTDLQTTYDTKTVPYYPEIKPSTTSNDKSVTRTRPDQGTKASQMRFRAGDVITHTRRYKKGTVKRCTPYYCDVFMGKTEQRWYNNRIAERHVGK